MGTRQFHRLSYLQHPLYPTLHSLLSDCLAVKEHMSLEPHCRTLFAWLLSFTLNPALTNMNAHGIDKLITD
jgi:hypothetical protein